MKILVRISLLCLLVLSLNCNNTAQRNVEENGLSEQLSPTSVFTLLPSTQTNIDFSNTVTEDLESKANLFDFDYFYNGAGAGIADINNDGLADIFFSGNQVDNKLYLNKGDFKFEDISETSGINIHKKWSNGVTFVDVNNDNLLDIYISQGGPLNREERKNLLYINQGDLTFKEEAEKYGLADMGISTQSAFFDFDNDGDLDCIVMNENELYGFDPINFYNLANKDEESKYYNSSHLYENREGKFIDVTKEAGILDPIFGLGLIVSDFNKDNYLDFYIASDYYIPDAMYINDGTGKFTNKIKDFTDQISFYGMGMDVADINNDNLEDIFVLDMASTDHVRSKTLMASMSTSKFDFLTKKSNFQYQYMFNSLQLNMGNGNYGNVAQMTNVAKTDWSWSALLADYDNDEDKDIFVTNGYRRYALDNDFRMKVFDTKKQYNNRVPLKLKEELYYEMPSEKLSNIIFENKGYLEFQNPNNNWGLSQPSYSNGASYGDLDNDGDLDLVVNNIDEKAFVYKNNTSENDDKEFLKIQLVGETSEPFAKIKIDYQGKSQFIESKRVRGYMSAVDSNVLFGLNRSTMVDTLTVTWTNGKSQKLYNIKSRSIVRLDQKDADLTLRKENIDQIFTQVDPATYNLNYSYRENDFDDFSAEVLLPYKQSTLGPFIASADINSDGIEDLYIGGAAGQKGEIFISENGKYKKLDTDFLNEDRMAEDMDAVFFDIDKDGDLDLFVVSGGYEFKFGDKNYADRLYINDGSQKFHKADLSALNNNMFSGKKVIKIDFDKDGDDDLIVGNRIFPGNYPKHAPSTVYRNDKGTLVDVSSEVAPDLESFGIINDMVATDFDHDGMMDFIAVGEWTTIGMFRNTNGTFKLQKLDDELSQLKGWWFSVSETDINNDGLKDYVIGNVGSNIKFKATKESPFKIYANDFDDNGTNDIVLGSEYRGEYVPVRGRECSSQQMPFILDKFPTFSEFANATLEDIYGNDLEKAYFKEVNTFKSIVLINTAKGQFTYKNLPKQFQTFPILSTIFMDVNSDGFEDAIIAGNIYNTEVETPRLDFRSGKVMISNGKDGYLDSHNMNLSLNLRGDIRKLKKVTLNNDELILALPNNGNLQMFKINN